MDDLKKEYDFFLEHKFDILKQYHGKFVVIKDQQILGSYEDRMTAIKETQKKHPIGTFIVQEATEKGNEVRFHSRVVI